MKNIVTLIILAVSLCLSSAAQQCSTPSTSIAPNGAITITWNCQVVQPGQNPLEDLVLPLQTQIQGPLRFSSISLSYQGGYFLYGNPNAMTTHISLPDVPSLDVPPQFIPQFIPQFFISGSGSYFSQFFGPFLYTGQDVFHIEQTVVLNGYTVANCYSFCGYSIVVTMNP